MHGEIVFTGTNRYNNNNKLVLGEYFEGDKLIKIANLNKVAILTVRPVFEHTLYIFLICQRTDKTFFKIKSKHRKLNIV